ncbi:MAG: DEAD/DEAH box helicase [Bacteroidetes bacterium]|nr:MAG: DEAD/DEAH box helicase [Bacteroidota bacterium]
MNFKALGLIDPILQALNDKSYTEPTPIQIQAIPVVLEGKDLLGIAQTGTGKTAAFAIPIIQRLENDKHVNRNRKIRSLVITPTRELAIQIHENFKAYSKHTDLKSNVIFGGVKQTNQVNRLKAGTDILIATPGRLLDLMNQKLVSIHNIEYFVLDEADRMLDMGFIHDIKKIIQQLPTERQTLFFSATMPDNIVELSRKILKNPVRVEVSPVSTAAETVQQFICHTNKDLKKELLVHLIKERNIKQVLIFERTKHGADKIARFLIKQKIKAAAIHGDKAQNHRQKVLDQFKNGELTALVATDIAARGIDIDRLQYVINLDIPNISETYVHRIGRVGRAGETGTAISIAEPEEKGFLRDIEKLINKKIEVLEGHPFPQTDKVMTKEEKKAFEAEKQRRKKEFFENRKKSGNFRR